MNAITYAPEEVCERVDGLLDDQASGARTALVSRTADVARRTLPA